jgi:hypothetical protein
MQEIVFGEAADLRQLLSVIGGGPAPLRYRTLIVRGFPTRLVIYATRAPTREP